MSAARWTAEGHDAPPSFQGKDFEYSADDPSMTIKAYYDLHIWLFRENPNGVFAPYNPNASCEHHVFNVPMMHPMP